MIKEKSLELDVVISEIEDSFGKGSIMRLGGGRVNKETEAIPTGISSIDDVTGIGGFPKGRIVEIIGPESSGKTTIALSVTKQIQKMSGAVSFITARDDFDLNWARVVGANVEDLLLSQPDTREDFIKIANRLSNSHKVDLIVIDSLHDLETTNDIESESDDIIQETEEKHLVCSIRELADSVTKSMTTVVFTNDERMRIGYPEITPFKIAMKSYSSMRVKLRTVDDIRKGEEMIGRKIRAKIIKNKFAPPFREAEFSIYHGKGISMCN